MAPKFVFWLSRLLTPLKCCNSRFEEPWSPEDGSLEIAVEPPVTA